MQAAWLSKGICLEIEKMIRGFVKGYSSSIRGLNLVRWEDVQQPITNEGLGFRDLKKYNQDRCLVDFWYDDWVENIGPLVLHAQSNSPPLPCPIVSFTSTSGNGNVRSTYLAINDAISNDGDNMWKLVWKLEIPQRIRVRQHMALDARCGLCKRGMED
ncbi:hypothetical protein V6N12_001320 [Hibiscus sabdariffa]|uniref:Uncharacterized protein n=1 Tax=Hibiscus sabdariffa TaxID=183260 RepID=A0ABR2C6Y8_9ROSI